MDENIRDLTVQRTLKWGTAFPEVLANTDAYTTTEYEDGTTAPSGLSKMELPNEWGPNGSVMAIKGGKVEWVTKTNATDVSNNIFGISMFANYSVNDTTYSDFGLQLGKANTSEYSVYDPTWTTGVAPPFPDSNTNQLLSSQSIGWISSSAGAASTTIGIRNYTDSSFSMLLGTKLSSMTGASYTDAKYSGEIIIGRSNKHKGERELASTPRVLTVGSGIITKGANVPTIPGAIDGRDDAMFITDVGDSYFTHNLTVYGDISATDASFINLSAVNVYGNIVGQFEGSLVGDVSGTDASFVDISAINFHGTHLGSVIGDVSGTDASFVDISSNNVYATSFYGTHMGDISGNNAKFVDISSMNIYLNEEGTIYVGDQVFSGGGGGGWVTNVTYSSISTAYDEDTYQGYNIGVGTSEPDASFVVIGDVSAHTFIGDISGIDASFVDVSAVRFNGLHIGDMIGNTLGDISGIDASFVDVSAARFNGLHIGNTLGDISGMDASFVDVSAAQLYGLHIGDTVGNTLGDISGIDASFVDVSAARFNGLHIGDMVGNTLGDISGIDASFVDVSAVRFNGLHIGDMVGNTLGDISGIDASFVDVSAARFFGEFIGDVIGIADEARILQNITTSEIVLKDTQQTLVDKTLTAPNITTPVITGATTCEDISGTDASFVDVSATHFFGEFIGSADEAKALQGIPSNKIIIEDTQQTLVDKTLTAPNITTPVITGATTCEDISGTDASFVDVSATHFFGEFIGSADEAKALQGIPSNKIIIEDTQQTLVDKTLTAPNITTPVITGTTTCEDISGTDASFVDVSATHFFGEFIGSADEAKALQGIPSNKIIIEDTQQTLVDKTLTAPTITNPTITGSGNISGVFTGDITGNVIGNVTGDVTGHVTGNAGTATKIASITNSDIVQLDDSQILTNKQLTAPTITNPTITGSGNIAGVFTGDITGNVTGNVTGNAGTATKIASITNSDIVQLDDSQILTNKTLTAPTITNPTITGSGNIAGVFAGNVTGDVTGNVTGDVTGNADTATKIASITNSDIVQLDNSQTLTNKQLTAPIITTPVITGATTCEDISGTDASFVDLNATNIYLPPNGTIYKGTEEFQTGGGTDEFVAALGGDAIGTISDASMINVRRLTDGSVSISSTYKFEDLTLPADGNILRGTEVYPLLLNGNAIGTISDSNIITVREESDGEVSINANYKFQDISANSITTTGNVGIGTTNPGELLEVYSSGDAAIIVKKGSEYYSKIYNYGELRLKNGNSNNQIVLRTGGNSSYLLNTNVGIGTNAPGYPLDIIADAGATYSMRVDKGITFKDTGSAIYNTSDGKLKIRNEQQNDIVIADDFHSSSTNKSGKVGIGTASPQQLLDVNGDTHINGKVGIGTPTPAKPLHIESTNFDDFIRLTRTNVGSMGLSATNPTGICTVNSSGNYTGIQILENGNVGIGTSSPDVPLHVNGIVSVMLDGGDYYRRDSDNYTYYHSSSTGNPNSNGLSAIFEHPILIGERIWIGDSGNMYNTSDYRIKTNIQDISSINTLDIINKIQVKEYNYIEDSNNPNKTIGFIAQNVKEWLPNAVSIKKSFFPDELRSIENISWIECTDVSLQVLKYKLIIPDIDFSNNNTGICKFYVSNDNNSNLIKKKIKVEPDNKTFIFDESWNNVFFYGKEVNDFHTLDKNKIFQLHHPAIQELSRLNDEKTAQIATLENELSSVKTQLASLEAKVNELLAKNA